MMMLFVKQINIKKIKKYNKNKNKENIIKIHVILSNKPASMGRCLTGRGTGRVAGTEKCILTRTRDTPTRVPAGSTRTRVDH